MQIQISWPLQKPTDLDLHCLQNRVYPGSAGQGLTSDRTVLACENYKQQFLYMYMRHWRNHIAKRIFYNIIQTLIRLWMYRLVYSLVCQDMPQQSHMVQARLKQIHIIRLSAAPFNITIGHLTILFLERLSPLSG